MIMLSLLYQRYIYLFQRDPMLSHFGSHTTWNILQYVTITRLEIGYVVNKVCQFVSQTLQNHSIARKITMKYLKAMALDHDLVLQDASPLSPSSLQAYCDVD
ncbi:hypothetical protein MTR_5g078550 [Medicago truncatula]|uniref:Uncharacterized protein n=1 Tax=Medicago truncatula TaxID=3880 RepID=G7K1S2_MEDTR|nr:hypothetical protein MTR_5g078550 [Medicago truncatula]